MKTIEQNPYVEQAEVFLRKSEGDYFVIGHMRVKPRLRVPESPTFLHNEQVKAKVKRIAGFEEDGVRRVLYHAESSEQAEAILQLFLQGEGYSINKLPVIFEGVFGSLPKDLERIAEQTIKQYRSRATS